MRVTITIADDNAGVMVRHYPLVSGGPDSRITEDPIWSDPEPRADGVAKRELLGVHYTFEFTARPDGEGMLCYAHTNGPKDTE